MPDFDAGFKIAAHHSARELCRLGSVNCDALEPLGDTLQTTERLADRAFLAKSGEERFVVYFEAYTTWNAAAPWNIMSKSALLSERERLPTRTLVFVLTPERYREQGGTFRLESGNQPTQQVWFREICMWLEKPEPWWEQAPGLMALLPLCDHEGTPEDAVVHAAHAITVQTPDTVDRANLLATLAFFGKLACPALAVLDLIGREQMRESKFFQEVMAEGKTEGIREGIQEGIRSSLMEVLESRLGSSAAVEFSASVKDVTDTAQLRDLLRLASKARSPAAFRRALAARVP